MSSHPNEILTRYHLRTTKQAGDLLSLFLFVISPLFSQNSDKKALRRFWKEQRKTFLRKERSPLDERTIRGLCHCHFNPAFQIPARVSRIGAGAVVPLATPNGWVRNHEAYAYLEFKQPGQTPRLTVYRLTDASRLPAAYRDRLFLPVNDPTNGVQTYGGGRYIDLGPAGMEGEEGLLDFNRAYNLYCAFAEGYSCPVPPINNRLELAIEAGECNFAATFRH